MLSETERQKIEQRLLEEREEVFDALGHFEDSIQELREQAGELTLYRQHLADVGTESHEQEKRFLLGSLEGRRLYAIDEALSKLYKEPDRFGVCERCGRDIAFERLEVLPAAKLCADCQRNAEGGGGDADHRETRSAGG